MEVDPLGDVDVLCSIDDALDRMKRVIEGGMIESGRKRGINQT